jgi:hypothetical protein
MVMVYRPGYIWNGTEWVSFGPDNIASIPYQASEPTSPQIGDLWIDSDGDSSLIDMSSYSTTSQIASTYSPISTTGLVLITTVTIGNAVSSVLVPNVFSSAYPNYKITINGGTCSSNSAGLQLKLGSSTASYYMGLRGIFYAGGDATETTNNGSAFNQAGSGTNNWLHMNCDLFSPYLATYTTAQFQQVRDAYEAIGGGVHKVASSYTDFTVTPDAGTLTGGTIKVYGYK